MSTRDCVVPLAVKLMRCNGCGGEFGITDLNTGRVGAFVQIRRHGQAAGGGGAGDQLQDDLVVGQRPSTPVVEMNENSRCSILFHFDVPAG